MTGQQDLGRSTGLTPRSAMPKSATPRLARASTSEARSPRNPTEYLAPSPRPATTQPPRRTHTPRGTPVTPRAAPSSAPSSPSSSPSPSPRSRNGTHNKLIRQSIGRVNGVGGGFAAPSLPHPPRFETSGSSSSSGGEEEGKTRVVPVPASARRHTTPRDGPTLDRMHSAPLHTPPQHAKATIIQVSPKTLPLSHTGPSTNPRFPTHKKPSPGFTPPPNQPPSHLSPLLRAQAYLYGMNKCRVNHITALSVLESAHKKDPTDTLVTAWLGRMLHPNCPGHVVPKDAVRGEVLLKGSLANLKTLASEGDAEAMFLLASHLYQRKATQSLAVEMYRKSADLGHAHAQFDLAVLLGVGTDGVPRDPEEAVRHLRLSAQQGNVDAQYELGEVLAQGRGGVGQDRAEACQWYREAAKWGDGEAAFALGVAYYTGQGVELNYRSAEEWYRRAAELGVPAAQFNLGNMCYRGQGATHSNAEAVVWFRRAAMGGVSEAAQALKLVELMLPVDQDTPPQPRRIQSGRV